MQKYLFILLSFLMGSAGSALAIPFEGEIITLEKIARDIRSPLELKIKDMKKTYRVREDAPGQLSFINKNGAIVAKFTYISKTYTNNNGQIERIETTTIKDKKDIETLKEVVHTVARPSLLLRDSDPLARVFFSAQYSQYELSEGETHKTVTLSNDSKEFLRIESHRVTAIPNRISQNDAIQTTLFFEGMKILSITDSNTQNGRVRALEYETHQKFYYFNVQGIGIERGINALGKYTVRATQLPGSPFIQYDYQIQNGAEAFYSFNKFSEEFDNGIYLGIITQGIVNLMSKLTEHYFPETVRRRVLGSGGKFLEELRLIQVQVDQARTNPAILNQIKIKILEFISGIEEGTLQVNDQRKGN